jgi:protein-S-isoprenylcysteine O-methyltransferase Ste14
VSTPLPPRTALTRTAAQIVVVWSFALLLLPWLATRVDEALGLDAVGTSATRVVGIVLLGAASVWGLRAGWEMAVRGHGTPLPLAAAPVLVTSGPYTWTRNPMAISGVAQTLGVALILGSPTALLIPVAGALLWQCVIAPREDRFMADTFGPQYVAYRAAVPIWRIRRPRDVHAAEQPSPGQQPSDDAER